MRHGLARRSRSNVTKLDQGQVPQSWRRPGNQALRRLRSCCADVENGARGRLKPGRSPTGSRRTGAQRGKASIRTSSPLSFLLWDSPEYFEIGAVKQHGVGIARNRLNCRTICKVHCRQGSQPCHCTKSRIVSPVLTEPSLACTGPGAQPCWGAFVPASAAGSSRGYQ